MRTRQDEIDWLRQLIDEKLAETPRGSGGNAYDRGFGGGQRSALAYMLGCLTGIEARVKAEESMGPEECMSRSWEEAKDGLLSKPLTGEELWAAAAEAGIKEKESE